jgi:hypothetical protein
MLRLILSIALVVVSAITAGAETPGCTQVSNLSAARLRWATVRKTHVDPAHNLQNCRSYATNFLEAVTTRQTASICKEGMDRKRTLELLDSEIEAFNDLIATLCSR